MNHLPFSKSPKGAQTVILSRRVNEAVVLGDRIILTVARLLVGEAELAIQERAGGLPTLFRLGIGEARNIGSDIRVTLVAIGTGGGKARLSFEAPPSVSMYRKEVWDGPRAPLILPRAGEEPSPN